MIHHCPRGDYPFVDKLEGARQYLYFCRQWIMSGDDVVIFWKPAAGRPRRFCSATGGMDMMGDLRVPKPRVVHDDELEEGVFDRLMNQALEAGVLSATSQPAGISTMACTDLYMARFGEGRENCFHIGAAYREDRRVEKLEKLFTGPFGLKRFYDSLDRAR